MLWKKEIKEKLVQDYINKNEPIPGGENAKRT